MSNSGVKRKGIILAGGKGSRLYPITQVTSKQLLPVYDKPMIYYPLTTLMMAGIDDLLLISTPEAQPDFQTLLGDGSQWGIRISYKGQPKPEGIAQAFLIGEDYIGDDPVLLILGDNIFYGENLPTFLKDVSQRATDATIFAYPVSDPARFGIVTLDKGGRPLSIEEKPTSPQSQLAVPGLYFYDSDVVDLARTIKPDAKGELQITDINKIYLEKNKLTVEVLSRGWAWLDSGTHDALLDAGNFARIIEKRTSLKLACPEEVAYRMGLIDGQALENLARSMENEDYGRYLLDILRW